MHSRVRALFFSASFFYTMPPYNPRTFVEVEIPLMPPAKTKTLRSSHHDERIKNIESSQKPLAIVKRAAEKGKHRANDDIHLSEPHTIQSKKRKRKLQPAKEKGKGKACVANYTDTDTDIDKDSHNDNNDLDHHKIFDFDNLSDGDFSDIGCDNSRGCSADTPIAPIKKHCGGAHDIQR